METWGLLGAVGISVAAAATYQFAEPAPMVYAQPTVQHVSRVVETTCQQHAVDAVIILVEHYNIHKYLKAEANEVAGQVFEVQGVTTIGTLGGRTALCTGVLRLRTEMLEEFDTNHTQQQSDAPDFPENEKRCNEVRHRSMNEWLRELNEGTCPGQTALTREQLRQRNEAKLQATIQRIPIAMGYSTLVMISGTQDYYPMEIEYRVMLTDSGGYRVIVDHDPIARMMR